MNIFISLVHLAQKLSNTDGEYRRDVLSFFKYAPGASLLDLGCGDGDFTLEVAAKIGTRHISGLEGGSENVVSAKEKGVTCLQGDLEARLPFEDNSFDVVCANQVIEHLSNTDGFIREIRRVLRPEGYAIISTPNLAACHSIIFLLIGWQPHLADVSDTFFWAGRPHTRAEEGLAESMPHHRRIFVPGALKELLQYHNFKIERITGSGWRPAPAFLARVLARLFRSHADIITVSVTKK